MEFRYQELHDLTKPVLDQYPWILSSLLAISFILLIYILWKDLY